MQLSKALLGVLAMAAIASAQCNLYVCNTQAARTQLLNLGLNAIAVPDDLNLLNTDYSDQNYPQIEYEDYTDVRFLAPGSGGNSNYTGIYYFHSLEVDANEVYHDEKYLDFYERAGDVCSWTFSSSSDTTGIEAEEDAIIRQGYPIDPSDWSTGTISVELPKKASGDNWRYVVFSSVYSEETVGLDPEFDNDSPAGVLATYSFTCPASLTSIDQDDCWIGVHDSVYNLEPTSDTMKLVSQVIYTGDNSEEVSIRGLRFEFMNDTAVRFIQESGTTSTGLQLHLSQCKFLDCLGADVSVQIYADNADVRIDSCAFMKTVYYRHSFYSYSEYRTSGWVDTGYGCNAHVLVYMDRPDGDLETDGIVVDSCRFSLDTDYQNYYYEGKCVNAYEYAVLAMYRSAGESSTEYDKTVNLTVSNSVIEGPYFGGTSVTYLLVDHVANYRSINGVSFDTVVYNGVINGISVYNGTSDLLVEDCGFHQCVNGIQYAKNFAVENVTPEYFLTHCSGTSRLDSPIDDSYYFTLPSSNIDITGCGFYETGVFDAEEICDYLEASRVLLEMEVDTTGEENDTTYTYGMCSHFKRFLKNTGRCVRLNGEINNYCIDDCTVEGSTYYAIEVEARAHSSGSIVNHITNNRVFNSLGASIAVKSSDIEISGNVVNPDTSEVGDFFTGSMSREGLIAAFDEFDNNELPLSYGIAIHAYTRGGCYDSRNFLIEDNQLHNTPVQSILLEGNTSGRVVDGVVANNQCSVSTYVHGWPCIWLSDCDSVRVYSNFFKGIGTGHVYGITMDNSSYCSVEDNTLQGIDYVLAMRTENMYGKSSRAIHHNKVHGNRFYNVRHNSRALVELGIRPLNRSLRGVTCGQYTYSCCEEEASGFTSVLGAYANEITSNVIVMDQGEALNSDMELLKLNYPYHYDDLGSGVESAEQFYLGGLLDATDQLSGYTFDFVYDHEEDQNVFSGNLFSVFGNENTFTGDSCQLGYNRHYMYTCENNAIEQYRDYSSEYYRSDVLSESASGGYLDAFKNNIWDVELVFEASGADSVLAEIVVDPTRDEFGETGSRDLGTLLSVVAEYYDVPVVVRYTGGYVALESISVPAGLDVRFVGDGVAYLVMYNDGNIQLDAGATLDVENIRIVFSDSSNSILLGNGSSLKMYNTYVIGSEGCSIVLGDSTAMRLENSEMNQIDISASLSSDISLSGDSRLYDIEMEIDSGTSIQVLGGGSTVIQNVSVEQLTFNENPAANPNPIIVNTQLNDDTLQIIDCFMLARKRNAVSHLGGHLEMIRGEIQEAYVGVFQTDTTSSLLDSTFFDRSRGGAINIYGQNASAEIVGVTTDRGKYHSVYVFDCDDVTIAGCDFYGGNVGVYTWYSEVVLDTSKITGGSWAIRCVDSDVFAENFAENQIRKLDNSYSAHAIDGLGSRLHFRCGYNRIYATDSCSIYDASGTTSLDGRYNWWYSTDTLEVADMLCLEMDNVVFMPIAMDSLFGHTECEDISRSSRSFACAQEKMVDAPYHALSLLQDAVQINDNTSKALASLRQIYSLAASGKISAEEALKVTLDLEKSANSASIQHEIKLYQIFIHGLLRGHVSAALEFEALDAASKKGNARLIRFAIYEYIRAFADGEIDERVKCASMFDGFTRQDLHRYLEGEQPVEYSDFNDELYIPESFQIRNCFPNPFNPVTQVQFDVPELCDVQLKVYNLRGQLVAVLVDEELSAGIHEVLFDGSRLSTGIYFVHATSNLGMKDTKKVTLIK